MQCSSHDEGRWISVENGLAKSRCGVVERRGGQMGWRWEKWDSSRTAAGDAGISTQHRYIIHMTFYLTNSHHEGVQRLRGYLTLHHYLAASG